MLSQEVSHDDVVKCVPRWPDVHHETEFEHIEEKASLLVATQEETCTLPPDVVLLLRVDWKLVVSTQVKAHVVGELGVLAT